MNEKNRTEEGFTALSNLIAEPVIIINQRGIVLAANNFIKETTGFSSAEMVGKNFLLLDFINKENKEILIKNFGKRLKGIDIEPYEIYVTTKNGENRYFEVRAKIIEYAGELVDLVVFHDVTERRHVQDQLQVNLDAKCNNLRETEERLRSIFDSSPDAITLFDLNGTIIECNQATFNLHGFSSKEELIGKNAFQLISPEDREKAASVMRQLLEVGTIGTFKFSFLTKDGKKFPAEGCAGIIKDASGQPKSFVSITRDTSDRQRMEQSLKDSEEKYHKLFEDAIDAIFLADAATGIIVDCNRAASTLTGFGKSEIIGKHQKDFHPKEEGEDKFTNSFKMHLEGKGGTAAETQIVTKDGKIRVVAVKANRLDLNGKKLMQGIFRDITENKKVQESLEKKSQDLDRIIDSSPITIFYKDKEGKFVRVNKTFADAQKNPEEDFLGKTVFDLYSAEIAQRMADDDSEVLKSGIPKRGIIEQFESAMGMRWLETDKVPFFDKNGMVIGLVGFALDITERRKAEEDIRCLARFPSENPNPVMRIGKDSTILYANAAAKSLFGDLLVEEGKPAPLQVQRNVAEVMKTGTRRTLEVRYGDRVFLFTFAPFPNAAYVNVYAIDITDLKESEKAVIASEEKFRAISNSVRDAIILVDQEARIEYWNPAAEETFGYTREEALNQNVHELVIPDSMCGEGRRVLKRGFARFVKTGTGAFIDGNVELIGRRKDGAEFPVKLSLSPMKVGATWHVVGVVKDITTQKHKEQIAREYAEKLEEAIAARTSELKTANESLLKLERMAAIGELAGMVGHDLRNPLTGIKNAAYFLKKKGVAISENDSKAMLEVIEKGISHSDKIINDLLNYARDMHLQLQTCSFEKLLAEASAMVKLPENVKIVNKASCDFEIRSDQNKIERVFINLIKNAVEAMPNGGTLTIDCKQNDDQVEISFADTGVGIPEEILSKIFLPLFTTKAQGMGFGLAICKRIVDAHGGTIKVETEKGRGTKFTLALPIESKMISGGEKVWINIPESSLSTTTKA